MHGVARKKVVSKVTALPARREVLKGVNRQSPTQSDKKDRRIMREWGVGRFSGELVAVVDLYPIAMNSLT